MSIQENLNLVLRKIPKNVTLVAVSKTKPNTFIEEAYQTGQRIFGENKVQEMVSKHEALPKDIQWHLIGHLQKNKVKYIAPFVSLIHGIDSLATLKEINKQAKKNDRIINCLLQVKIAKEETKFGFSPKEIINVLNSSELKDLKNVSVKGLMGMASFTHDKAQLKNEFSTLKKIYDQFSFNTLSMGMSGDYEIAIDQGSTMVRVGSAIFGTRS